MSENLYRAFDAERLLPQSPSPKSRSRSNMWPYPASAAEPIAISSDSTGARPVSICAAARMKCWRVCRTPQAPCRNAISSNEPAVAPPPARGVAREVTLLPRHWEWLNASPAAPRGVCAGCSNDARPSLAIGSPAARRGMRAYHFMSAMSVICRISRKPRRALFADLPSALQQADRNLARRYSRPFRQARYSDRAE